MKMKQPNFQELFYNHFGGKPRKVTYSIRQDSNRHHDIVFLSSLIHDARFQIENLVRRGSRLTILINRDCWELGTTKTNRGQELHIADARLTVSPIKAIEWQFAHGLSASNKELWIRSIWLNHDTSDNMREVVIDGHNWRCILKMNADDIRIRLSDLETPFLFSQRKRNRGEQGACVVREPRGGPRAPQP